MGFYRRLPRVVKDLIVFNSFIFMMQFILNYGLGENFIIRSEALLAANVGVLIVFLVKYRIEKVREEERAEKNKNK